MPSFIRGRTSGSTTVPRSVANRNLARVSGLDSSTGAARVGQQRRDNAEYYDVNNGGVKMFSDAEMRMMQGGDVDAANRALASAQAAYDKDPSPINKKRLDNAKYVQTSISTGANAKQQRADKAATNEAQKDYGLAKTVTDDMYKVAPELLGKSARADVTADPRAIEAQNRAMDELFGIYSNGGATAQERARMARTRADQDQYLRSAQESQQQDLAERGMLGSGAEIAMALGSRQNAGTRMAQQDLETEAMLQDRALNALMQGSNVASQVRGSSFNEGMARGTASDEIAAINNATMNAGINSNVDFMRQSKANLAQQQYDAWQRGLDRNTGIATGIMGFDQDENQTGWQSGQQTAANDANTANAAKQNDVSNYLAANGQQPGQSYGVATGTNASVSSGEKTMGSAPNTVIGGVGQVAEGATGGMAGGASAGAMNFGAPDDDEEP